jgi:hypothetical protein
MRSASPSVIRRVWTCGFIRATSNFDVVVFEGGFELCERRESGRVDVGDALGVEVEPARGLGGAADGLEHSTLDVLLVGDEELRVADRGDTPDDVQHAGDQQQDPRKRPPAAGTGPAAARGRSRILGTTAEMSIGEERDKQGAPNAQANCPDTNMGKLDPTGAGESGSGAVVDRSGLEQVSPKSDVRCSSPWSSAWSRTVPVSAVLPSLG